VEVRNGGRFSSEPSAVTGSGSESFRTLARAIRGVTPEVVVAPYLVVVVTDARYFAAPGTDVLRFLPVRLTPGDLARIHGVNERIAITNYADAIRTYRQLILEATGRP
jgi:carboxypeptidase PM20D1